MNLSWNLSLHGCQNSVCYCENHTQDCCGEGWRTRGRIYTDVSIFSPCVDEQCRTRCSLQSVTRRTSLFILSQAQFNRTASKIRSLDKKHLLIWVIVHWSFSLLLPLRKYGKVWCRRTKLFRTGKKAEWAWKKSVVNATKLSPCSRNSSRKKAKEIEKS